MGTTFQGDGVFAVWVPILKSNGEPERMPLKKEVSITAFFDRIPKESIVSAVGTISQAHRETPELGWCPKIGAAVFETRSVQYYSR